MIFKYWHKTHQLLHLKCLVTRKQIVIILVKSQGDNPSYYRFYITILWFLIVLQIKSRQTLWNIMFDRLDLNCNALKRLCKGFCIYNSSIINWIHWLATQYEVVNANNIASYLTLVNTNILGCAQSPGKISCGSWFPLNYIWKVKYNFSGRWSIICLRVP